MKNTQKNSVKFDFLDALGFTLLELMAVVTIVGVLASAGVMNYTRSVQRHYVENYTKELASVLNKARTKAVGDGVNVWLIISTKYYPSNNPGRFTPGYYAGVWAATASLNAGNSYLDFADANNDGNLDGEARETVGRSIQRYYTGTQTGWGYTYGSNGYRVHGLASGCIKASNPFAGCGTGQMIAVIRPDGFVYSPTSGAAGSPFELAEFGAYINSYALGVDGTYSQGAASISPSGMVKSVY